MLTKEIKPEDLVADEVYKIRSLDGDEYLFTYLGAGRIMIESGWIGSLKGYLLEDDVILTIPLSELFINLNFN